MERYGIYLYVLFFLHIAIYGIRIHIVILFGKGLFFADELIIVDEIMNNGGTWYVYFITSELGFL